MKPSFSQRIGIETIEKPFLYQEVSDRLRIRVWNFIEKELIDIDCNPDFGCSCLYGLFENYIVEYRVLRRDEIPRDFNHAKDLFETEIFKSEWNKFFDFLEFLCAYEAVRFFQFKASEESAVRALLAGEKIETVTISNCEFFSDAFNKILENENSAYRLIGGLVQEITDQNEISEIETAINDNPIQHSKDHLKQALKMMSDRENPDFRNSIKESVSAIESLVKSLLDDDNISLSNALAKFEKTKGLHSSHKQGFIKLYGWTSDGDGIRHALTDK